MELLLRTLYSTKIDTGFINFVPGPNIKLLNENPGSGKEDILVENTSVEGTLYWKEGQFILQSGPIAKLTEQQLTDALKDALEKVYQKAAYCDLFEGITDIGHFDFNIDAGTTYYHCIDNSIIAEPFDDSGQPTEITGIAQILMIQSGTVLAS